MINNDDSLTLKDFLKTNYEELFKSIEKENYNIDYLDFDEFCEIICDNKVVGFIALEKFDILNVKSIVDSYILPDFRGKGLLGKNLIKLFESTHYKILSKKPTRSFIYALLKAGLAYKLSDDYVFSALTFEVNIKDAYKNSKLKHLYKKVMPERENIHYYSNLFDLKINCLLFNDNDHNFSKKPETLIIVEPRKYDLKKYKSRKKLKKISANYLDDIFITYLENIEDTLENLNNLDDFTQNYTIEKFIGSEDKLNESFVELLDEANLTSEDGFNIRKSILHSLNSDEIKNKAIKDRLTFLISNPKFIGRDVTEGNDMFDCSFCNNCLYDAELGVCHFCGHTVDLDKLFSRMDEIFNSENFQEALEEELINSNNFPEISDDELDEDFLKFLESRDSIDFEQEFSAENNDFLNEFSEFNEKLNDILGEDQEEFFENLRQGNIEKVEEIFKKRADMPRPDWVFEEGNKLDNKLLKIIDENNYDEEKVLDSQTRICVYEFVKHINENITSWKLGSLCELNHVLIDFDEFALNEGYVEKIMADEFQLYLDNYSTYELKEELKYFDIKPEISRENILKQFADHGDFSYVITEKGVEYLKSFPMLDFFATNLSEFLFYEFEQYYTENKDKFDLEEIGNRYINGEFKKAVKHGELEVYLMFLEYHCSVNMAKQNYDEALYYLIQRVIYEVNDWYLKDSHYSFELGISLKTASFFNKFYLLDIEYDLDEIYNRAFNEFKFGHMKNNKEKIHEFCERLLNGCHVIELNDDLLDEYFNNK